MRDCPQDALTALVGSRICHDLISPLGAIGNGIELMQMAGLPDTPELALISESVENANARIRFFRIAYGATVDGQTVKGSEMAAALQASFKGSQITLDWQPEDMCRMRAKLSFLMLQCLESALPYGGHIRAVSAPGQVAFHATANRMAVDRELWSSLTGPLNIDGLRPAQVQFGLLASEAANSDFRVTVDIGEGHIDFDVRRMG